MPFGPRSLGDCLTTLTRQLDDPDDLEVVVVDDGSRDATGEIAASFADRLPRLQVVRNDRPVGLASARNQGLDLTTGRYLAYLDGDDWLVPGHLARQVAVITALGVDFLRTDHVQTTAGRRTVVRAPEARRHRVLAPRDSILPDHTSTMVDYCYAWAGIFDSRIAPLLRFPDGLHTAEDRAWCWRLHLEAAPDAAAYLELLAREPELLALFFKRKRLALLGLPGSPPRRRRRDDLRRRLAAAGQRWTQPVNSR